MKVSRIPGPESGPGIRARNPVYETLIFKNVLHIYSYEYNIL